MRAGTDGGSLKGGAPRAVWQMLEADPVTVSARSAAQRLDQQGQASHLVWNPLNGEIIQLIPIVRAARSLACADGDCAGGWADQAAVAQVLAEGRVCVQISVVGFAHDPFTGGPMAGLRQIMTWLDSWGVPRDWPAGPPVSIPDGATAGRSRRLWARGGHFGASQVPGLSATGPGAIDVEQLTGGPLGHPAGVTPLSGRRVAAGRLAERPADRPAEAGYAPDFGAFLGGRVASAASLTRVR
jgi:hypothetical protein